MKDNAGRPNVVMILTDDQGYADFGCHGNPDIQTPNLDALYEESLHLTDFHMAPSCAPARAGLMTGRYNDRSCVWHTIGGRSILHKDEITMGRIFQKAGYHTAVFGKWHLGDNYPYRAHDRGFDEAVIHRGGGIGQAPDYWGNDYFENVFDDRGTPKAYNGYCTDVFFGLAADFMTRYREEPFLLYLAPNAPHYPLRAPQKYVDLYQGRLPDSRARCYGMLTNIDDNVKQLRDKLAELEIEGNTIFIYASDNGGEFGFTLDENGFLLEGHNGGMRGMKCGAYEGGHRVPCFIRYPGGGMDVKRDIRDCTSNMDLLPTLMELCGISDSLGACFDGTSLAGLLRGEQARLPTRSLVVDSQRLTVPEKYKTCAVMRDKWRLIDGRELYDLNTDFEQRTNVAALYPQLTEELKKDYERWWADVSARFDEPVPISIGAPEENPVFLSSHDWRGSESESIWNQGEIRRGLYRNSYLELFAERDGIYSFELRRWPREAGLAIRAGIKGELSDVNDWYSGGKALSIVRAAIQLGEFADEQPVSEEDRKIVFQTRLNRGVVRLQTWFYDAGGASLGAYYVYAEYVSG